MGELLVQSKVITPEQLGEILSSPRAAGTKLGQALLERGWINEAQLTQTLSLQLSVPWVSLYHIDFSRQLLNRVSRELAERYCLIPIFVRHVKGQGETLYVAMDDPTNQAALTDVSRLAGLPARPMIASASDIRSAIRVYYGDPNERAPVIDVPPPPPRLDPPTTTREGRRDPVTPSRVEVAPPTSAVATQPDPPRQHLSSRPPPPRAASVPPPPQATAARRQAPSAASLETEGPVTTRSSPPAPPSSTSDVATKDRESDPGRPRARGKMVSLTLLDGTTISLPAQKRSKDKFGGDQGLTARDFVSALRATAHGADASEILGDEVRWEPVIAALLSILLRKGLIADWEFVEELRKI